MLSDKQKNRFHHEQQFSIILITKNRCFLLKMILSILSPDVSSTSHSYFLTLCIDYFARDNYEIIITLYLMPNTTRFRPCLVRHSIDKPEMIKLQTTKTLNWRHRNCPRRSLLSVARLLEFYFLPCQLQSRFRFSTTWRLLFDQLI